VPVLWDKRLGTIVNNEVRPSKEIEVRQGGGWSRCSANACLCTHHPLDDDDDPHRHNHTHAHIQSGDILRMLNSEFNAFAMNPHLDLYPSDLAVKLEEAEGWLHDCVTDGASHLWRGRMMFAFGKIGCRVNTSVSSGPPKLSRTLF
jgi:hypothetical protein